MHNYACRFGAPSNSPKEGREEPPTNSPEGERGLTPGQSSRFKVRNLSGNHTFHLSLVTCHLD